MGSLTLLLLLKGTLVIWPWADFGEISHTYQNKLALEGQQDEETHYQAYWSFQQSVDLFERDLKRALDIKKTTS